MARHTPIYLRTVVNSPKGMQYWVHTFLSDLEAPDPVQPVVYSPYGGKVKYSRASSGEECVKSQLTVPPVLGYD